MGTRLLFMACLLILSACTRPTAPADFGEYLDEATGTTVVHVPEPAVYYRDVPALAAHARDYVSLAPVELSQAGQRRYLLWVWRWSTIDRSVPAPAGRERLILVVDEEPMELRASRRPSLDRWPYAAPVNGGQGSFYALSRSQVARLGRAGQTAVYLEDGSSAVEYLPWRDTRSEFRAFARRVEGRGAPGLTAASFDE